MVNGKAWTTSDIETLTRLYAITPAAELASLLCRPKFSIYNKAQQLGLARNSNTGNIQKGQRRGTETEFKKGHIPANKGLRRPGYAPGRMSETQFKKGQRRGIAVLLYRPIGTERISRDGYLERKVNDDMPLQRRWRAVHLLVWEAENGPVPSGHAVVFKDGNKTNIVLSNLELISRADLARRNSMWANYPRELAETIQLAGALKRKINRRRDREEQNGGS